MEIIRSDRTVRYILERRCSDGGFCFYQLDEPNTADTFWALASLAALGIRPRDAATAEYLAAYQRADGGFASPYTAYHAIQALRILGRPPPADPSPWLQEHLVLPGDRDRPVESTSRFEPLYLIADLHRTLHLRVDPRARGTIVRGLLRMLHESGGFGRPPTLIETHHALSILQALGHPIGSLGCGTFLRLCEDPRFGFVNVPGSQPSYLEHIHAGVQACLLLSYPSSVLECCEALIRRCRHASGGYARSVYGGISTLENTWMALAALSGIRMLEQACPLPPQREVLDLSKPRG
ncbi:MAG: prenyltransferase/squalene oxidase repeat-containing protein [Methanomicrobiales archaeon]|nr:prenyltransferase/squalene oxidase repeat-containing protein [Methanomicrobiales archaeon]